MIRFVALTYMMNSVIQPLRSLSVRSVRHVLSQINIGMPGTTYLDRDPNYPLPVGNNPYIVQILRYHVAIWQTSHNFTLYPVLAKHFGRLGYRRTKERRGLVVFLVFLRGAFGSHPQHLIVAYYERREARDPKRASWLRQPAPVRAEEDACSSRAPIRPKQGAHGGVSSIVVVIVGIGGRRAAIVDGGK